MSRDYEIIENGFGNGLIVKRNGVEVRIDINGNNGVIVTGGDTNDLVPYSKNGLPAFIVQPRKVR